jgi:hypothetical protein
VLFKQGKKKYRDERRYRKGMCFYFFYCRKAKPPSCRKKIKIAHGNAGMPKGGKTMPKAQPMAGFLLRWLAATAYNFAQVNKCCRAERSNILEIAALPHKTRS